MNRGHVPAEVLASYADGSLADGMCLIVAGHLTFCPRCREHLGRLEALGGALLAEPPAGCCAKPDLGRILSRLDDPEAAEAPTRPVAGFAPLPSACATLDHLPRCLRERLGSALSLGWREAAPGVALVPVPVDGPQTLRLFRFDAGASLPEHEHPSASTALLLRGTMREGGRMFRRGDLVFSDSGERHAPVIDPDEPCVVLLLEGEAALDVMPGAPSSPG